MKIKILIVDPEGRENTERIEDIIGVKLKKTERGNLLEVEFNSTASVIYPDGKERDLKCVKVRTIPIFNEESCKIKIEV